jgi:hypothetical protein
MNGTAAQISRRIFDFHHESFHRVDQFPPQSHNERFLDIIPSRGPEVADKLVQHNSLRVLAPGGIGRDGAVEVAVGGGWHLWEPRKRRKEIRTTPRPVYVSMSVYGIELSLTVAKQAL